MEKLYYQIGEVAKMLGASQSCIRFWMQEFDLEVKRGHGRTKYRVLRPDDIEELKEIQYLLNIRGFTIKGAKKILEEAEYNHEIQAMLTVVEISAILA